MRTATSLAVSTIATALLLAAPAAAQTPPPLPPIPGLDDLPGKVVRFQVTIRGSQLDDIAFNWNPAPGPGCILYAEGTLLEFWEFQRGKSVVMEFRKLGGRVIVRRKGRPLGDTAFAAPGTVTRKAGGFFQAPAASGCPTFPFDQAACSQALKARSDLRLEWSKGVLKLKESGPAAQNENPAESCGALVAPATNFGGNLSFSYPLMNPQKGKLSRDWIFDSKQSRKLELNAKFLEDPDLPTGFTSFKEKMTGTTVVTLKRL